MKPAFPLRASNGSFMRYGMVKLARKFTKMLMMDATRYDRSRLRSAVVTT